MAAPYGTRSRNRTGSSRPNYAEDKDYDVEMYDYDHHKSHGDSKKSSRLAHATNAGEAGARGSTSSRKSLGDDVARTGPSQSASKEHTPATTTGTPQATQSSNSATQPSRKRKAAAAAQQANSSAASASSRRGGTSTPATQSPACSPWPETNVLNFTNSGARPQDGRLVADDGTVLEANGRS